MKRNKPLVLFKAVQTLINEARQHIVRNVNTTMLLTYFEIGRMIIDDEQKGNKRAGYAKEILVNLSTYLSNKNKELVGADMSIETNYFLEKETLETIVPTVYVKGVAEEFSFSTIIENKGNNLPVSMLVVDSEYPIYGDLELMSGQFSTPKPNQIYIDQNTASKLNISAEDDVIFSNTKYTIAGVIKKDPRQLL